MWYDSGNTTIYGYLFKPLQASFIATPTLGAASLTVQFTAPAQRSAQRGARDTETGFTDVETKPLYISVGDARTIQYVYDSLGRLVEANS